MKQTVLDRFLRYACVDTASDPSVTTYPSTNKQTLFNQQLEKELLELGFADVNLDEHSYLTATIPASEGFEDRPVVGFIAHVDTSPDAPSANIQPIVHTDYDGGVLTLPHGVLSPEEYPEMLKFVGHTLISSSGDTLLGADDKAGVSAIISAGKYLLDHPEITHGKIRVAFTCDEEIGCGVDYFDVEAFGADYAYTLDSGDLALLEYENFNAASATVKITGRNIHPGYAKDKMINALELAHAFHGALPAFERPQFTSNYEGFYHLTSLSGDVNGAQLSYIIRDHDSSTFAQRQVVMQKIASEINAKYPESVEVTIKEQYRNMREVVEQQMWIVDRACEAFKRLGLEAEVRPIRGGTDGARLSFMGLPCPNVFTGGMNFHSCHEYLSLESMELAAWAVIEIAKES
ncbi:MAG: peptidase T [Rikenellaceae bacterium]